MYIIINDTRYDNVSKTTEFHKITYTSENLVEGISCDSIKEYRDDGFFLRELDTKSYLTQISNAGEFILSNESFAFDTIPEGTPAESREYAYETVRCIEYGDEKITVDQANKLYLQYLAEGDTERTSELTILIAAAKSEIRNQYPDVTE